MARAKKATEVLADPLDADRWRQLQVGHRLLNRSDAGAHVHAFEARRDLDEPLKIFAAHFHLSGQLVDGRERSERGG